MSRIGFDNNKYIKLQSEHIMHRLSDFGGKLYLEFGGKLFDDFHAARVLPGFAPDSKVNMLRALKDEAEIIITINASAIESNKKRGDLNITYDMEVIRLIDAFRGIGLYVGSVVVTQYSGQPAADAFIKRLDMLGIKNYKHYPIEGYPNDVHMIVSDEGYGKNDYIETERKLVVITGPGPGSGKMATCLSQLYHEHKQGIRAGYAKFETFPIWNLPLKHPVNLAYEAATADLNDVNMIDPFHLQAYGVPTVNYNRDVEIFPVLNDIFCKIFGSCPYQSPTDMGVNMAGNCISDDAACCEASRQEIVRRYYASMCLAKQGVEGVEPVRKIELVMKQANIKADCRPVIATAMELSEETGEPTAAIQLDDGRIITGKNGDLLGATSAMLLNALKALCDLPDELHLISSEFIEPVQKLKVEHLGGVNPRLHTDEVLLALSICGATDPNAALALQQLSKLKNCEAHSSVILSEVDSMTMRKLGINLTCEPRYQSNKLFQK